VAGAGGGGGWEKGLRLCSCVAAANEQLGNIVCKRVKRFRRKQHWQASAIIPIADSYFGTLDVHQPPFFDRLARFRVAAQQGGAQAFTLHGRGLHSLVQLLPSSNCLFQ
jgi:hypothetical protein